MEEYWTRTIDNLQDAMEVVKEKIGRSAVGSSRCCRLYVRMVSGWVWMPGRRLFVRFMPAVHPACGENSWRLSANAVRSFRKIRFNLCF